jgi:hypothetical protein
MVAISKEALEWLDRADQAREVAGQLTDPGARKAVLQVADTFDRLARAAARRPRSRQEIVAPYSGPLTDEEVVALTRSLSDTVDADRYPLFPACRS